MQNPFSADQPGSIRDMFARIAPRYDRVNLLLSLGQDKSWRRHVARICAGWNPGVILDVATGSGVLALELQRTMPAARIVGADFCAPMLERARCRGLRNLVLADGMALPFRDETFDLVTIAFGLRNMASFERALQEMHRVLKDTGHLVVLDFSIPSGPLCWLYRPYLHVVLPRLAGLLTGEPKAYRYLGRSIESFPRGARFLDLLDRLGFAETCAQPLSNGVVSVYFGAKG